MRRELRAEDDGYRSELVPGLRASADASRLAREIAFSGSRLLALAAEPYGLYATISALAAEDLERATWACFLTAYLCPLGSGEDDDADEEDPFAGIRRALAEGPERGAPSSAAHPPACPSSRGSRWGRAAPMTRPRGRDAGRIPAVGRARRHRCGVGGAGGRHGGPDPGDGLHRGSRAGAPSAASRGCSSASRSPGSGAWGAMSCS